MNSSRSSCVYRNIRILDYDFYYLQVVPLYCACLIELEKPGELYYLAHKLVASNPSLAVAWFAVVGTRVTGRARTTS